MNLIKTKHKTWCEEGRTNGACFHSFVFSLSPFVLPFPHTLSLFSRCKREGKQKERQWSEVKRAFLLFPSSFTWCVEWMEQSALHYIPLPLFPSLTHHPYDLEIYPVSRSYSPKSKGKKNKWERRKRARKRAPFSLFTYAFSVVWWSEWNESVRSLTFHLLRFIHTTHSIINKNSYIFMVFCSFAVPSLQWKRERRQQEKHKTWCG